MLPVDDTTYFFIPGELQLRVIAASVDPFVWAVWGPLSGTNMKETVRHWEDPERAGLAPMFGWLCIGCCPMNHRQPIWR